MLRLRYSQFNVVKHYISTTKLSAMQPTPGPPVQAQQPPQPMQPMQPVQPMQPMQPIQPMAAYQPQPKFLEKYGTYSFSKWLTIGLILIVIGAMFTNVTDLVGAPNPSNYDADEGAKLQSDQFSHESLDTSLGAFAAMLQATGLGLISYGLLREAYDGDAHHTAVRVTAVITGVLVITNVAASNLSIL